MAISTTKPVNTVKNADKPAQVAAKKKSEKEVEEKKTTKKPAAKKSTAKKTDDKKPAGKKKANPNFSFRAKEDYRLVVKALEEGDQKAYANLMARYRDSVNYVLLKMVHNNEDAEDLTIEAFAKAFKKLENMILSTLSVLGYIKSQLILQSILSDVKKEKKVQLKKQFL